MFCIFARFKVIVKLRLCAVSQI